MDTGTIRKHSVTLCRRADGQGPSGALLAYVACQVAIIGVAASGIDGFRADVKISEAGLWLFVVWLVRRGSRLAWGLLAVYSIFAFLTMAVFAAGRSYDFGSASIVGLLAMQVAVMFSPRMREGWRAGAGR